MLETLRAIPFPAHLAPLEDARLLRLAANLAGAALSARLELYPRNMSARDALELSQSALAGADAIAIADLRDRLRDRYPEAAPLPEHPELDGLLDAAGYDWKWDDAAPSTALPAPAPTSPASSSRSATQLFRRTHDVPPAERDDFETARDTEHKLSVAAAQRAPLILTTAIRDYSEAIDEIVKRFDPEIIDFDRALLDSMRTLAQTRNISWDRVITADADRRTAFIAHASHPLPRTPWRESKPSFAPPLAPSCSSTQA